MPHENLPKDFVHWIAGGVTTLFFTLMGLFMKWTNSRHKRHERRLDKIEQREKGYATGDDIRELRGDMNEGFKSIRDRIDKHFDK